MERQGCYTQLLDELQASGQNEASLTDADSRKMKGAHGHLIGYNVQVAVDNKHDLIVAEEVVPAANDLAQLHPLAMAAKEMLHVQTLQAVADKGYHEAGQLAACAQTGIETFVPAPQRTGGQSPSGQTVFAKEQFRYDAARDVYHCPGGQDLARAGKSQNHGKVRWRYQNRAACANCPLRAQCTSATHRVIARGDNEAAVEAAAVRTAAHPEKIGARKEIVEHVFGTLRLWGHDTFLLRGLAKVRGEFCLSALAYNLRRVLNLVSVPELLRVLSALKYRAVEIAKNAAQGRLGFRLLLAIRIPLPQGCPPTTRFICGRVGHFSTLAARSPANVFTQSVQRGVS